MDSSPPELGREEGVISEISWQLPLALSGHICFPRFNSQRYLLPCVRKEGGGRPLLLSPQSRRDVLFIENGRYRARHVNCITTLVRNTVPSHVSRLPLPDSCSQAQIMQGLLRFVWHKPKAGKEGCCQDTQND